MNYYGDVSGHFRGLLQNDCPYCIVGVVAGDSMSCGRCPKRAVRRIDNIPEAKWNDLLEKQKRRLFECFADQDHIKFGCAVFTREKLHSLENYHLLHQDVDFPPAWDLALTGYAYGEILFEMGALDEQRAILEFDRVSSNTQSEAVADHAQAFVPGLQTMIAGSRQSPGVQAADCLAGAIAEDLKKKTSWLEIIDPESVMEASKMSLIQLENALSNAGD